MSIWMRLFGYLRPYRLQFVLALLSMIVLAVTTGLYPVLMEALTQKLIKGQAGGAPQLESSLHRLVEGLSMLGIDVRAYEATPAFSNYGVIALFGGVVAAKVLSQAFRFYLMGWIAQRVILDIRSQLFSSILRKGATFFRGETTGQLVARVMNDVSYVERAVTYAIPICLGDLLKVVVLTAVCLTQYPRLSLFASFLLLAVLPIFYFGRMLKRYAKRAQKTVGELTHRITETLGGIRVVQTYGQEDFEQGRFDQESQMYLNTMMKSVSVRAVQTPAMELIGAAALMITVGYAVAFLPPGESNPEKIIAFLLALVLIYEPVKALGRINSILMPGVAAAERVFSILDKSPDIQDQKGAKPVRGAPKQVRFDQVGFFYRDDEWVLRNFDLVLNENKMVALVGPSGGGKSTIASLLPRLYDVQEGRIGWDGEDIRRFSLESLRANISLVSQEVYLFNDSVFLNIAYGKPGASKLEVEAAAKKAFAHDFIIGLPEGYDSRVGERGVSLSGGQRQRIALARAFLRDAPVLILDEATSALDNESERKVQSALLRLVRDRISLVVAHRLSTVRMADEIVFLDQGNILERGTHEVLMAKSGAYAQFVRSASEWSDISVRSASEGDG